MALLREGTHPVWGAFALGYVSLSLGLDFYWLFTESGPIAWLAGTEAGVLNGHWVPGITVMLLFLAQVCALIVVKVVIERVTGKRMTAPTTP